jgi:hypothetical protein
MKRNDFFDNLNIFFNDAGEEEEYAFVQAVVYRDLKTGNIDSIQIVNKEYKEFMVVDRSGSIDFINMDEEENNVLIRVNSGKKKK